MYSNHIHLPTLVNFGEEKKANYDLPKYPPPLPLGAQSFNYSTHMGGETDLMTEEGEVQLSSSGSGLDLGLEISACNIHFLCLRDFRKVYLKIIFSKKFLNIHHKEIIFLERLQGQRFIPKFWPCIDKLF